jgi:outer membrane protein TolC
VVVDSRSGSLSLAKLFSSGTTVELGGSTSYTDSSQYSDTFTTNRLGVSVTQALLQGRDLRVNTARIKQARVETQISAYELRGFTELLVQTVESTFWDYALAQRQIEIYTDSLDLAEQQLTEIEERITIGQLAETELAAGKAEVALRKENLINARSTLARERLNLLRLLNPFDTVDWDADIDLDYETVVPNVTLDDVEQHVQVALTMRSDLNQAKLQLRRDELEVVRTRNGLLPRLDVFIDFGRSGYGDSFPHANRDIDTGGYDVTAGLLMEAPLSNRANRAQHKRAVLNKAQQLLALDNLEQLIQVDVRSAYIEVNRTLEQISATTATRTSQEEVLRAETEKFRVGKSTSILVAQAQRDLVASRIAEIEAVVDYLKALVELYRLEGSLLQRRGLDTPGSEPIAE